jgi:hypothetical protein
MGFQQNGFGPAISLCLAMDEFEQDRELGNLVAWARERRAELLDPDATRLPDASVEQVLKHLEGPIASYRRKLS